MKLSQPRSEIYIPDDQPLTEALSRTTHLAIGAHQDDIEMMAVDGILSCYQQPDRWFSGVVVTDGAGAPRAGEYADVTDREMAELRVQEQKRAAFLGGYAAQAFLGYPSGRVQHPGEGAVVEELAALLKATSPEVVYTHNLADKHPTHVGVAARVIQALRQLPDQLLPRAVYGGEAWRGLDWLVDEDKVIFDCSEHTNLQAALLGAFDSQISGGKRYDLAVMGRRIANATFLESHHTDQAQALQFAMDLTPLVRDRTLDLRDYVLAHVDRLRDAIADLLDSSLPGGSA